MIIFRLFSVCGEKPYFIISVSEVKLRMPSAKILEQKKQIVVDLADKMQKAVAGVMVDYRGLTVEEDTKLRNELRKAGVEYSVVKNTLTRFAANQIGYTEFDEVLNGPTALAMSYTDVVAPAKVLVEFAKKNNNLEIKAGDCTDSCVIYKTDKPRPEYKVKKDSSNWM